MRDREIDLTRSVSEQVGQQLQLCSRHFVSHHHHAINTNYFCNCPPYVAPPLAPNNVHVSLGEALSLLGEVTHHRKQSSQVEAEQSFRIRVQQRLQALVQRRVVLRLVVIQRHQANLHCVSYGLEHKVAVVQIFAGLLCGITLADLIGRHVPQQARQEDGLLHVLDGRAVSSQGQEEAVSVEPGVGGLHG